MSAKIRLLSTDFDGTLVAHGSDPVLDRGCMQHIEQLQESGVIWAINTGRSVELLQSGLIDFDFPCWHKTCDDGSAVSERSLDASGEAVAGLLRTLK